MLMYFLNFLLLFSRYSDKTILIVEFLWGIELAPRRHFRNTRIARDSLAAALNSILYVSISLAPPGIAAVLVMP